MHNLGATRPIFRTWVIVRQVDRRFAKAINYLQSLKLLLLLRRSTRRTQCTAKVGEKRHLCFGKYLETRKEQRTSRKVSLVKSACMGYSMKVNFIWNYQICLSRMIYESRIFSKFTDCSD